MDKYSLFLLISAVLVILAGVIVLKNFNNLGKSIYWLIYPDIISVWSKKKRRKDREHTFRFGVFILLCALLVGAVYLLFKYFPGDF